MSKTSWNSTKTSYCVLAVGLVLIFATLVCYRQIGEGLYGLLMAPQADLHGLALQRPRIHLSDWFFGLALVLGLLLVATPLAAFEKPGKVKGRPSTWMLLVAWPFILVTVGLDTESPIFAKAAESTHPTLEAPSPELIARALYGCRTNCDSLKEYESYKPALALATAASEQLKQRKCLAPSRLELPIACPDVPANSESLALFMTKVTPYLERSFVGCKQDWNLEYRVTNVDVRVIPSQAEPAGSPLLFAKAPALKALVCGFPDHDLTSARNMGGLLRALNLGEAGARNAVPYY